MLGEDAAASIALTKRPSLLECRPAFSNNYYPKSAASRTRDLVCQLIFLCMEEICLQFFY